MFRRIALLLAACWLIASGAVLAGESTKLDWDAWQRMPVLDDGRLMPLDTFARSAAETICGRVNPKLALRDEKKPRKFTASELLFSWLVEPEKWEDRPFLIGGHEQMREELLGLPLKTADGSRAKHVSPRQLEDATKFRMHLGALSRQRQASMSGKPFQLSAMDKKVKQLYEAYTLYRLITFNPSAADADRSRFNEKFSEAVHAWSPLSRDLAGFRKLDSEQETGAAISRAEEAMKKLLEMSKQDTFTLDEIDPPVTAFSQAADDVARLFTNHRDRLFRDPPDWEKEQLRRARTHLNVLAGKTNDLARLARQMHLALYDNGNSLRLVPALDPGGLEEDRAPDDDSQPWLNLQTLILGSDSLMKAYPRESLDGVRQAFSKAGSIYVARDDSQRAEKFAAALDEYAASVRELGQRIDPLREKLPIKHRDEALLAATAYPPPGHTSAELLYNRSDPFFWSWLTNVLALLCFALSFGVIRKPMFWLGIVVLLLAQLITCCGFGFRSYITGWAPVTNMFETVVFTGLVVAVLGLWFALFPLLGEGLNSAWRLAALPFGWEATPLTEEQTGLMHAKLWTAGSWLLLAVRVNLAIAVFFVLAWFPYSSAGETTIISLLPRTDLGSSIPTANDVLTWVVGLCVLLPTVWYLPRAVIAGAVGLAMVPRVLIKQGAADPLRQVLARKPYAMVGAAVGFMAALLAYYSPVFHKDIGSLMPVLRDNFWLTLHVLSVTTAYGAGALAWGLANVALAHYLFGRYRDPLLPSAEAVADGHKPAHGYSADAKAFHRRAPEPCAALATFVYKSTQVAVLLLAIGTITGGLWADVSWGRFWGWDPKEVWALISLLAYLLILHGRYAGWFGNFGLAIGSILGASAILMAWYGVNFVLPAGLHSYGEGAGGQFQVAMVVAVNWLFAAAAAVRYYLETHTSVRPVEAPDA